MLLSIKQALLALDQGWAKVLGLNDDKTRVVCNWMTIITIKFLSISSVSLGDEDTVLASHARTMLSYVTGI